MTLNGGILQTTKEKPDFEQDQYPFEESKLRSGGYGMWDHEGQDRKGCW